jgi:hypothetical protein
VLLATSVTGSVGTIWEGSTTEPEADGVAEAVGAGTSGCASPAAVVVGSGSGSTISVALGSRVALASLAVPVVIGMGTTEEGAPSVWVGSGSAGSDPDAVSAGRACESVGCSWSSVAQSVVVGTAGAASVVSPAAEVAEGSARVSEVISEAVTEAEAAGSVPVALVGAGAASEPVLEAGSGAGTVEFPGAGPGAGPADPSGRGSFPLLLPPG